jgi:hypothetical protein
VVGLTRRGPVNMVVPPTSDKRETVIVITRHNEGFDIHTHPIDPTKSRYAKLSRCYVERVVAFYKELGIESALWAYPEDQPPKHVEPCKPCEYVLQIDPNRVIAYVNEEKWSPYAMGDRDDFEYSTTPVVYPLMSLLSATPIAPDEVLIRRASSSPS